MMWFALAGGVALIAFALWAMIRGGGRVVNDQGRDLSNAQDLSMID